MSSAVVAQMLRVRRVSLTLRLFSEISNAYLKHTVVQKAAMPKYRISKKGDNPFALPKRKPPKKQLPGQDEACHCVELYLLGGSSRESGNI